jgi:succinate dehydrogenase / fumarate reductase cytochrome b subunit
MDRRTKDRLHFLLLKLHSLAGIVPIGLFLVFHLAFNTLRTVGVEQYRLGIDLINNTPFLIWIEIGVIIGPILFHSVMGFYIIYLGQSNVLRYPYPRNWMYTLQRLTGAALFAFLVYHVGTTVVPKMLAGKTQFAAAPFLIDLMNREFQTWQGRGVYLIGIFSAAFHFANGLWGFCLSWGILTGRNAQRRAGYAFLLVGVVLTLWGLAAVVEFSLHPLPATANLAGGALNF